MSETIDREEAWTVGPEEEGVRLDAAIAERTGASRSAAAAWCGEGRVGVEQAGRPVRPAKSLRLPEGARVTVSVPPPGASVRVIAETVDGFSILHEDADIVVVDKPAGVAAHPSPGWHGPTVVGALAAAGVAISTSGAAERRGVVHRLDVGTSGLMVVAKRESSYSALKRAFKERTVEKVYHTMVQGIPDPLRGTIDAPIGRHPGHEWRFAVVEDGRDSVTHYEVLEAFGPAALAEVHLETGRTHQIRVHFSALHHPCCGDLTYGADPRLSARLGLTRQWLHARRLGFQHPGTGSDVEFVSEYPADLRFALESMRSGDALG
ncbi:RluA family pseudouridine synthase [Rothia sp. AR01]|uniref:Pseudouridine synthase n=1 Tax=Rothia santali TaxID=2949643 RepID=A0A9X2HC34_9MICC|nr:RluA family pseudouridine synthase [Rothia santali]MCP3425535.1 RluA family pseudouridine synthase [Rothia santali]